MKKLLTIITLAVALQVANAQSVPMDWTRTDCFTSNQHHLFSELDSGMCVVIFFDMLPNCQSCINATHMMEPIVEAYKTVNPGKINLYCTGYSNSYTCATMTNWEAANGFNHDAMFTTGADEVAYYGGMGMPTIVVLGRDTNHVWWIDNDGIVPNDTIAFKEAMDSALYVAPVPSTIKNISGNNGAVKVYPNPATDQTTLSFESESAEPGTVTVYSVLGKQVFFKSTSLQTGNNTIEINTAQLPAGSYFLELKTKSFTRTMKLNIIK